MEDRRTLIERLQKKPIGNDNNKALIERLREKFKKAEEEAAILNPYLRSYRYALGKKADELDCEVDQLPLYAIVEVKLTWSNK